MEPRFPSPGLNFSPGGMVGPNSQNLANSFKNQNSSLEVSFVAEYISVIKNAQNRYVQ